MREATELDPRLRTVAEGIAPKPVPLGEELWTFIDLDHGPYPQPSLWERIKRLFA